jgi:hypothetical protein
VCRASRISERRADCRAKPSWIRHYDASNGTSRGASPSLQPKPTTEAMGTSEITCATHVGCRIEKAIAAAFVAKYNCTHSGLRLLGGVRVRGHQSMCSQSFLVVFFLGGVLPAISTKLANNGMIVRRAASAGPLWNQCNRFMGCTWITAVPVACQCRF